MKGSGQSLNSGPQIVRTCAASPCAVGFHPLDASGVETTAARPRGVLAKHPRNAPPRHGGGRGLRGGRGLSHSYLRWLWVHSLPASASIHRIVFVRIKTELGRY